ncbi:ribokinase [Parasteatoda tepidariorum]|uniref:ribokinase n=1 Tax=Parasteatoda tepidariorum TaxID=114398 RepID=UPI00077FDA1E|nr:ribokinase [Parasteatoda tepidariorum]
MVDIVVLGGCIVDLISYASRFPRPGETMAGKGFLKGCGGKGANQAVMANKLGAKTGLIAKLGDDSFGKEYFECLKETGIHPEFVTFSKNSQTSTAAITVTDEGLNNIVYVPGAIWDLTPNDVLNAEEIIKNSKVLLCTYECPLDSLFTALNIARKYNVKTVVNAAPANDQTYEKLYPLSDIICVNEVEAEEATGLPLKKIEDAGDVMTALLKKNCSTVILTLGSQGALYQSQNEKTYTHVSARKVQAIDSTGAGDAFMGTLVYFLAYHNDKSLHEIIKKACEIATLSVLKNGTQSSFPEKEDLPSEFFD